MSDTNKRDFYRSIHAFPDVEFCRRVQRLLDMHKRAPALGPLPSPHGFAHTPPSIPVPVDLNKKITHDHRHTRSDSAHKHADTHDTSSVKRKDKDRKSRIDRTIGSPSRNISPNKREDRTDVDPESENENDSDKAASRTPAVKREPLSTRKTRSSTRTKKKQTQTVDAEEKAEAKRASRERKYAPDSVRREKTTTKPSEKKKKEVKERAHSSPPMRRRRRDLLAEYPPIRILETIARVPVRQIKPKITGQMLRTRSPSPQRRGR